MCAERSNHCDTMEKEFASMTLRDLVDNVQLVMSAKYVKNLVKTIRDVRLKKFDHDSDSGEQIFTAQAIGKSVSGKKQSKSAPKGPFIPRIVYPDTGFDRPDYNTDTAMVGCTCFGYRFFCYVANKAARVHTGPGFPTYKRKTPVGSKRYPEKNPDRIPNVCKHISALAFHLVNEGYIDD